MAETLSAPPENRDVHEFGGVDDIMAMFEDDFARVETPRASEPDVPVRTITFEAPPRPADASRGVDEPAGAPTARPAGAPTNLHDLLNGDDSRDDEPLRAPTAPAEIPPATEMAAESAESAAEPSRPVVAESPRIVETRAEAAPVESEPPRTTPAEVAAAAVVLPPEPRAPIDYDNPLRLAFVSQERDADVQARHEAIRRRQEWAAEGGPVKRFVKGIWNTYVGDFKQIGYRKEARREMESNGDVFLGQSNAEARRSLQATMNRHTSDLEELIHRERGEKRGYVESEGALSTTIKDYIRQNIGGDLTDEALREEVVRAVNRYGEKSDKTAFHDGALIADNLLQIRDAVVGAREHEGGMERVLSELKISLGESRTGANTEMRYNAAERIAAKISSTRVGSLVGPEAVLVGATVAGSLLRLGGTRAAATALTVAPGVLGAGLSALRESRLTVDERVQTARDMAQGRHAEAGSKRREAMEGTVYHMAAAGDLAADLTRTSGEDVDLDDHDNLRSALEALAATRARVKASETRRIDLISYTEGNVETEREALDLAYAYAKRAVRTRFENEATLDALGLPRDLAFDGLIERQADLTIDILQGGENGIDARDRAFRKLKGKRVATAAATGLVTGLVVGAAAQELYASFDPTRQGLVEQLWHAKTETVGGQVHHTLLDGIVEGHDSHDVAVHHAASSEYASHTLGSDKADYRVSGDRSFVDNGDNSFDLKAPHGGTALEDLRYDDDGKLTDGSLGRLHDAGFTVTDHTENLTREVRHSGTVTANEFLSHHKGDVTRVQREFWYDNDTRAYDRNEQKLWWGGAGDRGLDGDGGYSMSVSHMMENGSFHDGMNADWRELAADGKLKLALSVDTGTQDRVIMVDINRDGSINIPKGTAGAELFSNRDGQAVFDGRYAEVVQLRGETSSGSERIAPLATVVGNGSAGNGNLHDNYVTREKYVHHQYTIKSDGYTTHERVGDYTEMAPVIPVVGRRGIETVNREADLRQLEGGYGYYYAYGETARYWDRWKEERSPRLRDNPDADLDTGTELAWYRQEQETVRGKEYVAEVDSYVDADPSLRALGNETEAIVCIPVAAANESENIYKTLSMFARQDEESRRKSVVLLNVNWKQGAGEEEGVQEKIDKTRSEIEHARRDFPDLRIASFEKEWSKEFISETKGKIYGEVIKVLYDTAALALERANREGRRENATKALLITNDADTLGMSRSYLMNYIKALNDNPEKDAFSGVIRRGVSSYGEFPGYGVASDFYAMLNMMMLRQQKTGNGGFTTEGPNSALTFAMYAAMGGAEERIGAGADAVLGQRLAAARREPGERSTWQSLLRRKGKPGSDKAIGKLVGGVQIDTMPARLLGAYRHGKWIASGWDNFDKDTYEDRNETGKGATLEREDPRTDMDAIARRIETSIEGFGSYWYRDPAVVASALALTFGSNGAERLYDYTWDFSKTGAGTFTFSFTDEGKKALRDRLLKDRRGRDDAFGDRLNRQLYNWSTGRAPVSAEPRLLS